MAFPLLDRELYFQRLRPPQGRVRAVIDSDAKNNIDDQFALVYALLSSDKIDVEAIYAAPFSNRRCLDPQAGMEQSYDEVLHLLTLLRRRPDNLAFKGAPNFLKDPKSPAPSPAATNIVDRAWSASGDTPLYVVALGALTNVASALLIEPQIIERIVVVWLGGHAHHWDHTGEFNLKQDIDAARIVLDSGVPLVHIPCMGVASHLQTTLPEIREYVAGKGAVGSYLYEIFEQDVGPEPAASKVIWDMAPIAYLINGTWLSTSIRPSPLLTEELTWRTDNERHPLRYINFIDRDAVFQDFFRKLRAHHESYIVS